MLRAVAGFPPVHEEVTLDILRHGCRGLGTPGLEGKTAQVEYNWDRVWSELGLGGRGETISRWWRKVIPGESRNRSGRC